MSSLATAGPVAPGRQVVIEESKNQSRPPWKQLWDEARELLRSGEYTLASEKYKILHELKPNIEEATWEYSKVLIEVQKWTQAASHLETLIEKDPTRKDYLLSAGQVALKRSNYHQAIKFFGLVYEDDPLGEMGEAALEGLIVGLLGEGKIKNSYLMMEQLYQRKGDNRDLLLKLAKTSLTLGKKEKAKFYYSKLIENFVVKDSVLFQAALLYENEGDTEKSVPLYEKYLERQPNYLPFRKKAAQYYLDENNKKSALPHLLKIYELEEKNRDNLLLIGKIYLYDEKRPDKALYYLEEYINRNPDDKKIKKEIGYIYTVLANNLISIVENDGVNQLWKDLARITPNREAIYLAMADLLQTLEKDKELLKVLKILHEHNKNDSAITLRLADLYLKRNNTERAMAYYKKLRGFEKQNPIFLKKMALILISQGKETEGLKEYLRYLQFAPADMEVIEDALRLAGDLGLIKELKYIFDTYADVSRGAKNFSIFDELYIDGLSNAGIFTEADKHYTRLLKKIDSTSSEGVRLRFHKVDTLLSREYIYQAEQSTREILADDVERVPALEKLIHIAIKDHQIDWAKSWFDVLARSEKVKYNSISYGQWPDNLFFLYVDIIIAEKNYDDAVDILKEYLSQTKESKGKYNRLRLQVYVKLLQLYFKNNEIDKCFRLVKRVEKKYPENIEIQVIKNIIASRQSEKFVNVIPNYKEQFDRLIGRAELEREYGAYDLALGTIDTFLKRVPTSTRALLLKIKILTDFGKYEDAQTLLKNLQRLAPQEEYFELKSLQLDYLQGNFSKIVQAFPHANTGTGLEVTSDTQIESHQHSINKRLILARSLWADKQWEKSLSVYDSLLKTPVIEDLEAKMNGKEINFHVPSLEKSFWNVITFTHPERPDPVSTIMKPAFVEQNIGKPIDHISASLYDKFRWQKLIESELSVRKAMRRRDYHEVEKEYQSLVEKGAAQDTLFDLAEVYGRLELYGKEAELYKEIREKGPVYPELNELERLNKLKRKPRVLATSAFSTRKGRERYVDIKKKMGGFEGWIMPTLRQELHFSYYRNLYSTTEREDTLWSHRLNGEHRTSLGSNLDILVGLGLEDITDVEETTLLYELEVKGKLLDKVQGRLHIYQDIEDDTLEAVENGIHHSNIEGGLSVDVVPRWLCGFDLLYREYSDNNQQNMVRLWTSYNMFGESYRLRLKYKYENTTSSTPNFGRDDAPLGFFASDDHPYWSPSEYWNHKIMFHFKHLFPLAKSDDNILSNYTIDYSFGYESGSHVTQDANFQIFLEMSRHFLLKGNFTYESARDNKETGVNLSLVYRW